MEVEKNKEAGIIDKNIYYVSTSKFIILNFATGGAYSIYWGYRQWKYLRNSGKNPQAIAWLAGLLIELTHYSLLKSFTTLKTKKALSSKEKILFITLFFVYIAWNGVSFFGGIFFALTWLAFVPLLYALKVVNGFFLSLDKNVQNQPKMAWWKYILIGLGLILSAAIFYTGSLSDEQLEKIFPQSEEVENIDSTV